WTASCSPRRHGAAVNMVWEAKTSTTPETEAVESMRAQAIGRRVVEVDASNEAEFARLVPEPQHRLQLLHECAVYVVEYAGYIRALYAETTGILRVVIVHFPPALLAAHLALCKRLEPLLAWLKQEPVV